MANGIRASTLAFLPAEFCGSRSLNNGFTWLAGSCITGVVNLTFRYLLSTPSKTDNTTPPPAIL
jgi:hypothetical protein